MTTLLLLGAGIGAFLCYLPSLRSDFVYDGRAQVLVDRYIHDRAHFADVLTLRVLKTEPLVGSRPMSRPGQMLLLMIEAAIWDKTPWGYHLTSIAFHAANVVLLTLLFVRLAREGGALPPAGERWLPWAAGLAALFFGLHPLTVEPVAEIGFSADLLTTFFTLAALNLAICFRPARTSRAIATAMGIVLCCFAAVASKETGLAAALLVGTYALLFRRAESRIAWAGLTPAALAATGAFLFARFSLAAPAPQTPTYIGGSFAMMLQLQPRLWVFMIGKLVWPTDLSADYQPANLSGVPLWLAVLVLTGVLLAQALLAWKSRPGALGVAIWWLGLAAVSNLMPLYRPLADRFYYLPLAGAALQLFAALLLLARWRIPFLAALTALALALVPLLVLTIERQSVFADSLSLWSDTLAVSSGSLTAADNLGFAWYDVGRFEDARQVFQRAITITRGTAADPWMGLALTQDALGQPEAAVASIRRAVALDPGYTSPAELQRQLILEDKYVAPLRAVLARAGIAPKPAAR